MISNEFKLAMAINVYKINVKGDSSDKVSNYMTGSDNYEIKRAVDMVNTFIDEIEKSSE